MVFFLVSALLFNIDSFFQTVVSDFSAHSNYLILCLDNNEKIAIENDNLFAYINKNKSIGKRKYKNRIFRILKYQQCITSAEICYEKESVYRVQHDEQVEINAKLGKNKFVELYFNNYVLKGGINQNKKFAIIAQLFEWKISCYQDDESGLLVMVPVPDQE